MISPYRLVKSILFIVTASYIGVAVYVYLFQSRLVFMPYRELNGTPADIGLDFEQLRLPIANTEQYIHAWSVPLASENDSGRWVLFCHGNAGNISHRLPLIQRLHKAGFSVLIFDYRGYGESPGKPSEENTYQDVKTAWNWLVDKKNARPKDIMVYGRSLGGSIAAWLAARENPGMLVIESSFTSIIEMGRNAYPYLPVAWLSRFKYPTLKYVQEYEGPTLILHSEDDEIVPIEMGRELYEAAAGEKAFAELRGGHNDGWDSMDRQYDEILQKHISELWPEEN